MKIKNFLIHFVVAFVVVFVVNAAVVYVFNFVWHGKGAFNWEMTFYFAITFGIALPLYYSWGIKGK